MKVLRYGLGPVLATALWLSPLESLSSESHRLAGIIAWVVCYWMLEPIPLAATAVLGTLAAILLQIAPTETIASAFFDPILLLFMGSFLFARLLALTRIDRRISNALLSHPWVGHRPRRMLWAFGLLAWFFAMWTSITACVAMLLPIAKALARHEETSGPPSSSESAAFLLYLTYAASAGAMATPIGTPPNMIGIRMIEHSLAISISFLEWMTFGVPIALVLLISRFVIILKFFPLPAHPVQPWLKRPVLSPRKSTQEKLIFLMQIDWSVLLLFGGGMALGRLMLDTGLAAIVGHSVISNMLQQHPAVLTAASVSLATVMSELASNTASANMVIPVLLAGIRDHSVIALSVALAATLGTSLGFMLPVSTPANAMVYGSGAIRMRDLVRTGLAVDLAGVLVIWLASLWFIPLVVG